MVGGHLIFRWLPLLLLLLLADTVSTLFVSSRNLTKKSHHFACSCLAKRGPPEPVIGHFPKKKEKPLLRIKRLLSCWSTAVAVPSSSSCSCCWLTRYWCGGRCCCCYSYCQPVSYVYYNCYFRKTRHCRLLSSCMLVVITFLCVRAHCRETHTMFLLSLLLQSMEATSEE